ncbi:CLUMA_CG017398, isoform A [Clunio marinus]|uniref:CLUMA_CG017398, isoform A n=1 Tax=Clunio marinus TaxID=568069 RepID=A0A1J1IXJ7_9DIPT|nr:CLUMA_CG017398, isoform A [Clunio marinus]
MEDGEEEEKKLMLFKSLPIFSLTHESGVVVGALKRSLIFFVLATTALGSNWEERQRSVYRGINEDYKKLSMEFLILIPKLLNDISIK